MSLQKSILQYRQRSWVQADKELHLNTIHIWYYTGDGIGQQK